MLIAKVENSSINTIDISSIIDKILIVVLHIALLSVLLTGIDTWFVLSNIFTIFNKFHKKT